jgi:Flp pilus assembly protein CpaB
MIVAGLLGVVLTLSVLRAADEKRTVLVAAHDVVPGTVLARDAVRTARVDASDDVMASLYTPEELDALEGRVATSSIARGTLVTRAAVRARSAGEAARSMSFPIPRAHAMGGALDTGDRVDILSVATGSADAGYVMTDVEVLAVDGGRGGPLGAPEDVIVTIAVDSEGAVHLAAALERGTVTLVRATGAAPMRDPEPARG